MSDDLPRQNNDPLEQLIKQDLDPLSMEELEDRIQKLTSEISRCESKKNFTKSHRIHADNLFRK